ncbi:DUF1311 domain-containing protein [Massilia sp. IC2-477]|uniref:lysozyme inhibitor LprI family protein n=1 Tax=Massilia sp. IC2-477 TaxID=2887198 RepID=UPI001D102432|nr:lysozyme inhibitor LprI family protein [Massilia sp. IC2-477]MCC2954449.1 DUF1311 domain-containing protein [Massilia sp. IC2-477]
MFRPYLNALLASLMFSACGLSSAAPYPNTSNFGVPFSEDESWYRQCMRVAQRSAPDLGRVKEPAPRCNAGDLYYVKRSQALTSPAEWRQVRECALAQEDDAVLMMLYANGFGVARDPDIAIHYACKLEFIAKAEMEARIAHLAGPQGAGAVFDQCDHITSGYMGAVCAGIREGQADRVRKARLERTVAALPGPARDALGKLRQAAERYAGTAETNMQGTAAPGLAIEREGKLLAQFDELLFDVLGKRLPAASPQDLARADKELNTAYRALMAPTPAERERPDRVGDSTITRADVRQAERAWIAYRDSFVTFRARLPSGPAPEAIQLALTRQRLAELKRIMEYRR